MQPNLMVERGKNIYGVYYSFGLDPFFFVVMEEIWKHRIREWTPTEEIFTSLVEMVTRML